MNKKTPKKALCMLLAGILGWWVLAHHAEAKKVKVIQFTCQGKEGDPDPLHHVEAEMKPPNTVIGWCVRESGKKAEAARTTCSKLDDLKVENQGAEVPAGGGRKMWIQLYCPIEASPPNT